MGLLGKVMGNAGVVPADELNNEYKNLLTENEQIEVGFRVIRDTFIFTNLRLILVDKQGLRGKKVEYMSLKYNAISRFSIETAGTFDLEAELKIWLSSEDLPTISKTFNKKVNIYDLQKVLANHVLR